MRSLWKDAERFSFSSGFEEGRDRCPYDPAKGYTGLLVGASPDGLFILWVVTGCHIQGGGAGGIAAFELFKVV